MKEYGVTDDKPITKGETLDINLSYPYDPEYEYFTRLERLNLDREREEDIKSNQGFIIAPTQGIKKDIKNPMSIFSRKFGQTIKDVNPFGNRYSCECGYTQNKVNNGTICKVCGTKVKYVDDNYQYFGWLVLKEHWIISPAFYNALRFFIGKDFDNIIKFQSLTTDDGHQERITDVKDQPYYGIGLIEFREKFEEIMKYYLNKNKKQANYDDIMREKDKVFTQSIPVFTVLLRPYDTDKYTFSHETTNQYYTMINKHVTELNKSSNIGMKNKRKGEPERKHVQDLLWKLQMKVDVLYSEIIDIIKGKKGNIRTLFGGRCNFTSRDVIIADPTLRIDQIRLPYSGWYHANLKKDKTIIAIIESIIHNSTPEHYGIPVIINRNPSLGLGSLLQMYCVGISDPTDKFEYVMQLPLQILPLLNADFDNCTITGQIRALMVFVAYYRNIIMKTLLIAGRC